MATSNKKLAITPLADRVLIEEVKEDAKTASGIILPDSMGGDDEMLRGKIIAVGPGRLLDGKPLPMNVKKGDKVLFKKWADKVKMDGTEYYLASESDLVATIS